MATRIVEGKKPYTGGEAIEITKDKVINLRLRDENNLIIYDEGDDEIYVDLQLEDGIEPTDAFPVGVTTGRVLVADDWDKTGTLISAKTTSGDNIQLLYADDGTLWIDNGTGTFKQVYLSTEIATILADYATKDYVDAHDTVVSSSEPEAPYEGMLWYNTTSDKLKVYDGTAWQDIGSGGGGSGDVVGPASSTDGHLAVFDGATGKLLKDGGAMPSIPSITTISITLTAANWSSKSITVTATGVTASNTVIVAPDPTSITDYTDGGVYCSSQASNSLTFECDTEPTNDIDVNVVILN